MNGLSKKERIVSRKLMDRLFSGAGSHTVAAFPVRAIYIINVRAQEPPVQILVSVSKRHFKHAVDRNRVKRQLRQAYRLNKQLIEAAVPQDRSVAVAFIWMSDEICTTAMVEKRMTSLLRRIAAQAAEQTADNDK